MTVRPIIFSAPMVRALLEGRKTQTRRLPQRQPAGNPFIEGNAIIDEYTNGTFDAWPTSYAPGDLLWVKEAWRTWVRYDDNPPREIPENVDVQYIADEPVSPWGSRYRHARFMMRWTSRLTLAVTDVRVQRLQEISDDDARAEGIYSIQCNDLGTQIPYYRSLHEPRVLYRMLWNSIHGPDAWDQNPWVVAVTFTAHKVNVDRFSNTRRTAEERDL